ncbi:ArsR/SmtB family transcription factor [Streptomyces odontomachi]|uniref:ArsR/SmtB family transcription factor n=1 Tax=Streptomyces odontomachi TaxID=2944940 RepID=UPI00210D555F|nr:helix-turn-helix domain-containing protein [Streptomyces sp. ODS25]
MAQEPGSRTPQSPDPGTTGTRTRHHAGAHTTPAPARGGTSVPVPHELSDLGALKALAQPRRQQILHHLTLHGPATSARLARGLGLNTGATSYHLRELARNGFVEETGGSGHGRERWWRAVPGDRRLVPPSRQSPEMRAVMDAVNHISYTVDLELFERLQREASADAGEWADAFPYSRGTIRLTLSELGEFFEAYVALLNRYKRPDAVTPPGARTILTRFLAFPVPEQAPAAGTTPSPGTAGDVDPSHHGRETETP